MADPALVFQDGQPADVPGVHAIVIGIGHHRHFPGGEGLEMDADGGTMSQLSSPPHSARTVADCLLETFHEDPEGPLRSLSMVIADRGGPAEYAHLLCPRRPVPDATLDSLRAAIQSWFQRGDAHEDNLLIFYICCHGISTGMQQTLLASDFLADQFDIFRHAIDFTQFHAGMSRCAAREQIYFVDASWTISENLMRDGSKGEPIVSSHAGAIKETAPIYRSRLEGKAAWGLPNQASPFAQALPKAFQGGAWDRELGRWHLGTTRLQGALEQQIKRLMRRFRTFSNLIEVDRAASLRLKSLAFDAHPIHPVEIACLPEVANETVVLTAHPEDRNEQIVIPSRVPPQKDSWLLDLRMGVYDMSARFPGHEINDPPDKEIFVHSDNVSEVIEVS